MLSVTDIHYMYQFQSRCWRQSILFFLQQPLIEQQVGLHIFEYFNATIFFKNSLFILFNITTPLVIFSSPRVGWLTHSICLFPQCDADERGPHHFLSAFSTLPLHALSQFMFLIAKVQTDCKRYEFICWGIERRRRKSVKNIKYYLPHSNLNVLFYRVED